MSVLSNELLHQFAEMFVNRHDDYAVQQHTGGYVRMGSPLTGALCEGMCKVIRR